MTQTAPDRYISFEGLDCDADADVIVERINQLVADRDRSGKWGEYFAGKMEEQRRMGVDNLFFVGSQLNNIYALFEACEEDGAGELLYKIEQECC